MNEEKRHIATPGVFIDEVSNFTRHLVSSKEKDDETQYSYFGARYYDADLSVWLSAESADQCVSIDPLSDKYPSMSAYMYCAGNPVMLVDPDGMSPGDPPFTVHYYYSLASGQQSTVHATYVSAGKRRGVDAWGAVLMGVFDFVPHGWIYSVGAAAYSAVENGDYDGFLELAATPPLETMEAICKTASEDEVVGINRAGFGNASKVFYGLSKLVSLRLTYDNIMNALNSPPSMDEQLAFLTYSAMMNSELGYMDIVNNGVFVFNPSFNGKRDEAETIANNTYKGMQSLFGGWDFSDPDAIAASESIVRTLGSRILRDSQRAFGGNDSSEPMF